MKALLILVVVLAGVWLWRQRGQPDRSVESPPTPPDSKPTDMVCCQRCGVHVPANEAVPGQQGPYCCKDHLRQSETQ